MEHVPLKCELQQVLDQFNNLRVNYYNSKINLKAKDRIIEIHNTNMEGAHNRIDMLAAAVENYKKQYQNNLLRLQGENYQLTRKIEELEGKCKDLQQINQGLLVESNDNQQVRRLEDEIEILENRIAAEEKQHNAQLDEIKRDCDKQIFEKLTLIDQLNEKIKILTQQLTTRPNRFVHPALYEEDKKIKNPVTVKKKTTNSAFKWPELDVQKTQNHNNSSQAALSKKRRKLYHAEEGEVVDLIS